jgi:hypothetical protein
MHPYLLSFRMAEGHAKRGKKVSGAMMVATQSRFHRDRLDGEQIVSKARKFNLVPNLQVATLTPTPRIDPCRPDSWR